uniref:Uncharacterized protein n=1 Tax=Molossus molossus TaxID=27622 RepID=A0A7J8J0E6_MOLMO|nr:hypothetical protein HJG59_010340 [Molossus molossus]
MAWDSGQPGAAGTSAGDANCKFRCKVLDHGKLLPEDPAFLEPRAEMTLSRPCGRRLPGFWSVCKPATPRSAVGPACMHLKRFYLTNSVMENTAPCKADECSVSSPQVTETPGESSRTGEVT